MGGNIVGKYLGEVCLFVCVFVCMCLCLVVFAFEKFRISTKTVEVKVHDVNGYHRLKYSRIFYKS